MEHVQPPAATIDFHFGDRSQHGDARSVTLSFGANQHDGPAFTASTPGLATASPGGTSPGHTPPSRRSASRRTANHRMRPSHSPGIMQQACYAAGETADASSFSSLMPGAVGVPATGSVSADADSPLDMLVRTLQDDAADGVQQLMALLEADKQQDHIAEASTQPANEAIAEADDAVTSHAHAAMVSQPSSSPMRADEDTPPLHIALTGMSEWPDLPLVPDWPDLPSLEDILSALRLEGGGGGGGTGGDADVVAAFRSMATDYEPGQQEQGMGSRQRMRLHAARRGGRDSAGAPSAPCPLPHGQDLAASSSAPVVMAPSHGSLPPAPAALSAWPWEVLLAAPAPHTPAALVDLLISGRLLTPPAGPAISTDTDRYAAGRGLSYQQYAVPAVVRVVCACEEDALRALALHGLRLACTQQQHAAKGQQAHCSSGMEAEGQGAAGSTQAACGGGMDGGQAVQTLCAWQSLSVRLLRAPQGAAGLAQLQDQAHMGQYAKAAMQAAGMGPSKQRLILTGLPGHIDNEQLAQLLASSSPAAGLQVTLLPGQYSSAAERRFLLQAACRQDTASVLSWHGVVLPDKDVDALGRPLTRTSRWSQISVQEESAAERAELQALLTRLHGHTPEAAAERAALLATHEQALRMSGRQAALRGVVCAASLGLAHPGDWDALEAQVCGQGQTVQDEHEAGQQQADRDAAAAALSARQVSHLSAGSSASTPKQGMGARDRGGGGQQASSSSGVHTRAERDEAACTQGAGQPVTSCGSGSGDTGMAPAAAAAPGPSRAGLSAVPTRRRAAHSQQQQQQQQQAQQQPSSVLHANGMALDGCPCCPAPFMTNAFVPGGKTAQQRAALAAEYDSGMFGMPGIGMGMGMGPVDGLPGLPDMAGMGPGGMDSLMQALVGMVLPQQASGGGSGSASSCTQRQGAGRHGAVAPQQAMAGAAQAQPAVQAADTAKPDSEAAGSGPAAADGGAGAVAGEADQVAPFFRRSRKRFPVRWSGAQGAGPEDCGSEEEEGAGEEEEEGAQDEEDAGTGAEGSERECGEATGAGGNATGSADGEAASPGQSV